MSKQALLENIIYALTLTRLYDFHKKEKDCRIGFYGGVLTFDFLN